MYLISIDDVNPHINSFYLTYRVGAKLLGFMPCASNTERSSSAYYSVSTPNGRVVPVFYVPDMLFDSESNGSSPGPALFFHGCDDGHTGYKFKSEDDAMTWLRNCPYADFESMFSDACMGKYTNLEFHN
jgi:hypothetical protein